MLDWLFGTSKKEKKQEISPQSLSKQEEWVYDFIKQYLVSPIWRNPLMDFIEENCSVFEDAQQNKFEYTKIFQEFISICSILIESIVEETGITERTLEKCIIRGLKSQRDRKIFTQILICDNFQMFKRIMISKNKQLEAQALKKIREETKTQDKVQDEIDQKERQRLELEQAIALSLALQQKAKDQEEQELQEAIRQSQVLYTEQEKKVEEKKVQKKEQKSVLGELPPLILNSVKTFQSHAEYKEEKQRLDKELNELRANKKTEEDSEQRKKRLQEQRQLLRKRKQEERQVQLKTFVENVIFLLFQKQATSIPEHNVTEEELQRRKKLMNRLKEQLKSD